MTPRGRMSPRLAFCDSAVSGSAIQACLRLFMTEKNAQEQLRSRPISPIVPFTADGVESEIRHASDLGIGQMQRRVFAPNDQNVLPRVFEVLC
jgi:hypothetical protein